MIPILTWQEEKRPRTRFRASDAQKLAIDIILQFQGVPETNPTLWTDTLRMAAGKGVELQMVSILKQNGIVDKNYDQASAPTVEFEREGIKIGMQFDALTKACVLKTGDINLPQDYEIKIGEGEPIEIKSINNKNSFDINDYINGNPRESYVMQLAIYMDYINKKQGHLFVSSIDGLNKFWFLCESLGEGKYKCGNITVDIYAEYKRFADIWSRKDQPITNWTEGCGRYKIPVNEIEWRKLSSTTIGKARNNNAVVGDENKWQIDYSPYKEMILKGQNVVKGYSEQEIETIALATKGYTTWGK